MSASVVQVGTFTTDASLTIRTWDDALARATGIAVDDAVGRALADVVPSVVTRGLLERFREVVNTGALHVLSPALHHYLLPCAPTLSSRHFDHMQQRVTVAPLRDEERITGVMVMIEDVTARLDAERHLAEALAAGRDDWTARRALVRELDQTRTPDFAIALVQLIRTHHHDFSLLSSSLQLLAGTGIDVSAALAELLRDDDPDLRVQAALALGQQPSAGAEHALLQALGDAHLNVRFQAIESLGQLRAVGAIDDLVRVAESEESFLAFAAIDALGAIKDPSTAMKLVPLLDRDELRPAVIHALALLRDDAAVASLVGALNRYSDVTDEIAQAVDSIYQHLEQTFGQGATVEHITAATIEERGIRHLLEAARVRRNVGAGVARLLGWVHTDESRAALVRMLAQPAARTTAIELLPRHGEKVVSHLIEQLASADDDLRHAVVLVLGTIGHPSATSALTELLRESPQLSASVAGALARIASPSAFTALLELLAHSDMGVRQAAIGALNSLGHPEMPSRVATLLESDDPLLRESAVRIAGYFGYAFACPRVVQLTADSVENVRCAAIENVPFFEDAAAARILGAAIRDPSASVREAAARALGRVDDAEARRALVDVLVDEAHWVRYFAVRALSEQRHLGAIPALRVVALEDKVPPVQIAAVEALAALDAAAAADVFTQLASHPVDELAAAAITALESLTTAQARTRVAGALDDARPAVRLAALRACAIHPSEATVPLLQRVMATDAQPAVRRAAVEALAVVARNDSETGDSAVAVLVGALPDVGWRQQAASALAGLPPNRLPSLSPHIHQWDEVTRREIVDTLGRSRHPEATTLLQDALNDPSARVRETAVLALRRRHVV